MIHPALILICAILCEAFVQFGKRASYWVTTNSTSVHYVPLLIGDLVFMGLTLSMMSHLKFRRAHWIIIGVFLVMVVYSAIVRGPIPTALAVRNTYFWILATVLFSVSARATAGRESAMLLQGSTKVLAIFLSLIAVVQVQTNYAFERPWFEFSGTSLNYDGVTNFGQASKAFSLMSAEREERL